MTVEPFNAAMPVTITGAGPYAIPFPYLSGAVTAVVVNGDQRVTLARDSDFTVSPGASETTGNLYLTATALALHAGATLEIGRATTIQQGWEGSAPREIGLERQLDALAMAAQDIRVLARSAVQPFVDVAAAEAAAESATASATALANARTFTSVAAAQAASFPASVTEVVCGDRVYRKASPAPGHGLSFLHPNGAWYDGKIVPTEGPVTVVVWMGQSGAVGVSGGLPGGRRMARDGVLVYNNNPQAELGQVAGWSGAGPQDQQWPLRRNNGVEPVGHWPHELAAQIHERTGGLVVVIGFGIGGSQLVDMMQGGYGGVGGSTGQIWNGVQSAWQAALDAPLPGRSGRTLRLMGIEHAHFLCIDQGEGDADYRSDAGNPAYTAKASTGAQYLARAGVLLDTLAAPTGSSIAVINEQTHILWAEVLNNGWSGGALNTGYRTGDRNAEIRSFPRALASAYRHRLSVLPTGWMDTLTFSGEKIGTGDAIHRTGAGLCRMGEIAADIGLRGPALQPANEATNLAWKVTDHGNGLVTLTRDVSLTGSQVLAVTFPAGLVGSAAYPISAAPTGSGSSTANAVLRFSAITDDGLTITNISTFSGAIRLAIGPVMKAEA